MRNDRKPSVSPAAPSVGDLLGRWYWLLAGAAIVLAGLLIYPAQISPQPILTDGAVYADNPAVRNHTVDWVTTPYYADTYRPIWRPLSTLSLRWNWDTEPGQREQAIRTNLFLFLGCAFLLMILMRRLGVSVPFAVAGSLLMAAHVGALGSVLQIAGRAELLAALLSLAGMTVYSLLVARHGHPIGSMRAVLWLPFGGLLLLALLAHEISLLMPVLLLGYEAILWNRRRSAENEPSDNGFGKRVVLLVVLVVVVAGSWGAFRSGVIRGWPHEIKRNPATDHVAALETSERQKLALSLPAYYLEMTLGRHHLPDHSHLLARPQGSPPIEVGNPRTYSVGTPSAARVTTGILILVAFLVGAVLLPRRSEAAALGCWWGFVVLLAILPLLGSNGQAASTRYLIWLLPGLLIVLMTGIDALCRGTGRFWKTSAAMVVVGALVVLAAGQTRAATKHWSSQQAVITHLERGAPRSPEVPLYKGIIAMQRGDFERAAALMEVSLDRFPRHPRALLNLAILRLQLGERGVGGRVLSDAAFVVDRVMPNSTVACRVYLTTGSYLIEQDLIEEATQAFRSAVAADSLNAQAHARLGFLEAARASTAHSGIRHIDRALELDQGKNGLGSLVDQILEMKQRAIDHLRGAGQWPDPGGTSDSPDQSDAPPE